MPVLLKDLGGLLWRLELFCRNLSARPEEVLALRNVLSDPEHRSTGAAGYWPKSAQSEPQKDWIDIFAAFEKIMSRCCQD